MDFIGIIRSLEELLYEVMSWLFFYPRTLWRILINPVAVAAYSDAEQNDKPAEQYTDTLSPPLLLMITMLINQLMGRLIAPVKIDAATAAGKALTSSTQNVLMLQALIFAIIPLVIALIGLWRNHLAIDRTALRRPFFSQCFLIVPFALLIQLATHVQRLPGPGRTVALMLTLAAFGWFIWAQTGWFAARLTVSRAAALAHALASIAAAILIGGAMAYAIAVSL